MNLKDKKFGEIIVKFKRKDKPECEELFKNVTLAEAKRFAMETRELTGSEIVSINILSCEDIVVDDFLPARDEMPSKFNIGDTVELLSPKIGADRPKFGIITKIAGESPFIYTVKLIKEEYTVNEKDIKITGTNLLKEAQ